MEHNEKECYWLRKEEDKNFLFQKRRQKIKMGKRLIDVGVKASIKDTEVNDQKLREINNIDVESIDKKGR